MVRTVILPRTMTNSKLIYITDPMCSWCYGFSVELDKVLSNLPANIHFEMVVGGLRPHGNERIKEMKSFLSHHWDEVNKRSGVMFNFNILDTCNLAYDTEPACRALVTFTELMPEKSYQYLKAIQKGFYFHNYSPTETSTFSIQALELGVDRNAFETLFNSAEMKQKTESQFLRAKQMGVNSFPTLLLQYNEQIIQLAQGYGNHKVILNRLKSTLEKTGI